MPEPYNVYTTQKADEIFPKGSRANEKNGDLWTYDQASGGWIAKAPPVPAPSILPGVMLEYGGFAAPSGYLLCDGAAVSRTTFAALFAVLGTAFGGGDGNTTFNVPDRRGRVGIGAGQSPGLSARARGDRFGDESITLDESQMPAHIHRMSGGGANNAPTNGGASRVASLINGYSPSSFTTGWTEQVGGNQSHSNVQPSLALVYIIKT